MSKTNRFVLTAWFLALGIVLPMVFGQLPQIGKMLLPMHIPVFLCAYLCGAKMATGMAVLLPLLRYALFLLPAFPLAVAAELATYALVTGWLYGRNPSPTYSDVYGSLLVAMVAGRVVRVIAQAGFFMAIGNSKVIPAFFTGTMLVGLAGAVLHVILIPPIVLFFQKNKTTTK